MPRPFGADFQVFKPSHALFYKSNAPRAVAGAALFDAIC